MHIQIFGFLDFLGLKNMHMHLSFFKLLGFWWAGYTCQTLNDRKVALCDRFHFSIILQ